MTAGPRRIAPLLTAALTCLAVVLPARLLAQEARPPHLEIGLGGRWTAGTTFPVVGASEATPSGGSFDLFTSRPRLGVTLSLEGRIGLRVSRALMVEASASYARPSLETRITGDFEGAGDITVSETLLRVGVEGALVLQRTGWHLAHGAPFVTAGGGYLRELHEGQTLIRTGQTFFVGGGVTYLRRPRTPSRSTVGLRIDVRVVARRRGVAPDEGVHVAPSAGASIFLGLR